MTTLAQLQMEFPNATLETWYRTPDGGWVENTARVYGNARVSGDARVSGNALVYGDARVSGNARVSGDARVYGDALVYGDARVSGDARVYGDAWDKSPLQIQGTRHFCCMSTFSILSIGCIEKTIADWQRTFAAIGKEQRYSKEEIAEYKLYIDLFAARYGSGSGSGSKVRRLLAEKAV